MRAKFKHPETGGWPIGEIIGQTLLKTTRCPDTLYDIQHKGRVFTSLKDVRPICDDPKLNKVPE